MTPNLEWYRSGILHFKRIFEEEELQEEATTKEFLVVRKEGSRRRLQDEIPIVQPARENPRN